MRVQTLQAVWLRLGIALLSLLWASAWGQSPGAPYPTRPIRFVVPYPAGAGNDLLARMMGQKMAERFGQPVIIENRPGAGGNIGLDFVARAAPDGYTIAIADTGPLAINATLYPKLPFNVQRDFSPVISLVTFQYLLLVNPAVKAGSLAELVALAKSEPGKLNYASVGNGSFVHLATELFKSRVGIDMTHVPFKASPEALQSVVAGETQVMFVNVQASAALIRADKLRALAVVGQRRIPEFPELPTTSEAGLADFGFRAWFGIVAPAAVPATIIMTLNEEFNRILRLPDVRDRLDKMGGIEISGGTPEQFAGLIRDETAAWGKVVRQTGATID